MNMKLLEMAQYNLEKLAELDKEAFEPMVGGQQAPQGAPVDPAAASGAPVDPAMAAAPQGAPVDPMAAGGAPAAGLPPPAVAQAAPSSSMDPAMMDAMVQAVRQVMQESGGGQSQGQGKGKGGKDVEERLGAIEAALAQVLQTLNMASPDQAVADAMSQAGRPKADGMSSGSGSPADGAGTVPAMGLMDPNAAGAMGELKVPNTMSGIKMSSAKVCPLDQMGKAAQLATALKNARRR